MDVLNYEQVLNYGQPYRYKQHTVRVSGFRADSVEVLLPNGQLNIVPVDELLPLPAPMLNPGEYQLLTQDLSLPWCRDFSWQSRAKPQLISDALQTILGARFGRPPHSKESCLIYLNSDIAAVPASIIEPYRLAIGNDFINEVADTRGEITEIINKAKELMSLALVDGFLDQRPTQFIIKSAKRNGSLLEVELIQIADPQQLLDATMLLQHYLVEEYQVIQQQVH